MSKYKTFKKKNAFYENDKDYLSDKKKVMPFNTLQDLDAYSENLGSTKRRSSIKAEKTNWNQKGPVLLS